MAKKKNQASRDNSGPAGDVGTQLPKKVNVTNDGGITVHQIAASDLKTWTDAGYVKHVPKPAEPKKP